MKLEKIRLWGNSDLERQMTHVLSHLQKLFFQIFRGRPETQGGWSLAKRQALFCRKKWQKIEKEEEFLADSVGNERSRLFMGRWLKLLGLSNDAPFKKKKQRERKQDISHFWGKEGRIKGSISFYGGGGVGMDRFEKRWKVGGTNWGYTQSSLLCLQEQKLRKL